MLDRHYIVNNADDIRRNNEVRNVTVDLDQFLQLDRKVRALKAELDEVNRQANERAAVLKSKQRQPNEEETRVGRELKEKRAGLETKLRSAEADLLDLQQ